MTLIDYTEAGRLLAEELTAAPGTPGAALARAHVEGYPLPPLHPVDAGAVAEAQRGVRVALVAYQREPCHATGWALHQAVDQLGQRHPDGPVEPQTIFHEITIHRGPTPGASIFQEIPDAQAETFARIIIGEEKPSETV